MENTRSSIWPRIVALLTVGGLLAIACVPARTDMILPDVTRGEPATRVPSTPTSVLMLRPEPTRMSEREPVVITVVYDNNAYDHRLETAWGFACVIERGDTTILFDTGGDGGRLLSNMGTLDLDPRDVDIVVLSHIHGDHTGGLAAVMATGVQPTVYVPQSFPGSFKAQVRDNADLVDVHQAMEITEGVYTTGEMGASTIEQGLVLRTPKGLVVITGCAHPGIAEMVRQAKVVGGENVHLVLGGFHLGSLSEARIKEIIADFRRLEVQNVAPCHCTGAKAINLFHDAYGEDFVRSGAGAVLVFD